MSLSFDEAKHEYRWSGAVVPSVTKIIAPLSDFSAIPSGVLEKARQEGKAIHSLVEWFEDGVLDEAGLPEWLQPHLAAWKKFKAESGWETDASEKRLYHKTYGYAGTLDLCGVAPKLKGIKGRGLVDLKRSLYDDPATGVQLAGYAEAENTSMPPAMRIAWRAGLKLNNDGTYRLQVFKSKADWPTFLACLTMWRWMQEHRA